MVGKIEHDADDLIYNRFDLIYGEDIDSLHYTDKENDYDIDVYREGNKAKINVWGKEFPQDIFEQIVDDIFQNKEVCSLEITRCGNKYQNFLQLTNDIRVSLPDTSEELMCRVERRDRATIRRKMRWLDERIGRLENLIYSNDIPDHLVEQYFKWKNITHGTDYHLSPQEYLKKYHVTDAMLMKAGDVNVAIAFFCQVNQVVFFENFSYNMELKQYSPGLLMYVQFMEELIKRKCKYLYLGGGSYVYKRRFGAEERVAYSGTIYRPEIVIALNDYFKTNDIATVAIYGVGVCGHSFLQLSRNLKIRVAYAIDREQKDDIEMDIFAPDDDFPKVDAVLITLNNRNADVERLLQNRFSVVLFWNDILDGILKQYKNNIVDQKIKI